MTHYCDSSNCDWKEKYDWDQDNTYLCFQFLYLSTDICFSSFLHAYNCIKVTDLK
jgi:hypothetical protein